MTPRRRFRPVWRAPELDPATFVRRVSTKIGVPYGRALVHEACALVEWSGDPGPWVRAVQQGRDAGTIEPAFAHFLIYTLTESAMMRIVGEDDILVDLSAQIEALERDAGLEEDEYFKVGEGPPAWEVLNAEWDARYDEVMSEMFRRAGEEGLATHPTGTDDELLERGRLAMFEPIEGLDVEDDPA